MKHRLWTPRLFAFVYTTGALAGLGALAYWFLTSPQKGLLTSSNDVRYALVGAFWAILGGVAINYKGISDHRHDAEWENGWMLWYLLRPFSALTVGLVTYAILDVVTQSSPSVPALAVLAFTFGTQEHRFFLLLYRAGGLVVSTPGDQQGIEITSINPATG